MRIKFVFVGLLLTHFISPSQVNASLTNQSDKSLIKNSSLSTSEKKALEKVSSYFVAQLHNSTVTIYNSAHHYKEVFSDSSESIKHIPLKDFKPSVLMPQGEHYKYLIFFVSDQSQKKMLEEFKPFSHAIAPDMQLCLIGKDHTLLSKDSEQIQLRSPYFYWCKKVQLLGQWKPIDLACMQLVFKSCKQLINKEEKKSAKNIRTVNDVSIIDFIIHCQRLYFSESVMDQKDYINLLIQYIYYINYLDMKSMNERQKKECKKIRYLFQNKLFDYDNYIQNEVGEVALISEEESYKAYFKAQVSDYKIFINTWKILSSYFEELVDDIVDDKSSLNLFDQEVYMLVLSKIAALASTQEHLSCVYDQSLLYDHLKFFTYLILLVSNRLLDLRERNTLLKENSIHPIESSLLDIKIDFFKNFISSLDQAANIIQSHCIFPHTNDWDSLRPPQNLFNYSLSTEGMQKFIDAIKNDFLKDSSNKRYKNIQSIYEHKLRLRKELEALKDTCEKVATIDVLIEFSNDMLQLTELGKTLWRNLTRLGSCTFYRYLDQEDHKIIAQIKNNIIICDLIKFRNFFDHIDYGDNSFLNGIAVTINSDELYTKMGISKQEAVPLVDDNKELTKDIPVMIPKDTEDNKKRSFVFSQKQKLVCGGIIILIGGLFYIFAQEPLKLFEALKVLGIKKLA